MIKYQEFNLFLRNDFYHYNQIPFTPFKWEELPRMSCQNYPPEFYCCFSCLWAGWPWANFSMSLPSPNIHKWKLRTATELCVLKTTFPSTANWLYRQTFSSGGFANVNLRNISFCPSELPSCSKQYVEVLHTLLEPSH